jgi:peptide deformylase
MGEILVVGDKKSEKILRAKAVRFDFGEHSKKEIQALVKSMREIMKRAQGVGLSANQIGLAFNMFVAQVPDQNGRPKFYAIFNPEISKVSKETEILEEGCLSVPGLFGTIERHARLTLSGQDSGGRKVKIKAWGLLAQVFQHETGHLNGELFIDRAKETHETPASERLSAREEKMKK